MADRVQWPRSVADTVLTQCHHRCCICPEHRRVANIHHIDGNHSNSVENNAVGLCGECHPDVHTTSTMRRAITPAQVLAYKQAWIAKCTDVNEFLRSNVKAFRNLYYLNVHRLDSLYREHQLNSIFAEVPHSYSDQNSHYNTLWSNPNNSLDWIALGENRAYFEARLFEITSQLRLIDVNLIEVQAADAESLVGKMVGFSCQFIGHDIPDQEELIESKGVISGPAPTMRREVVDASSESVTETCLMLDCNFMYADSSFIQFSEAGTWNGIGRVLKCRNAVGSNDGHLLRRQIIVSPICIGTPVDHGHSSGIAAKSVGADAQHQKLISSIEDLS